MITIIAAVAKNGAIGKEGKLPWSNLKGELSWFRKATEGRAVIMGRKTWQGLPGKLLGRLNIVVSSQDIEMGDRQFTSLQDAIDEFPHGIIIGGAEIYKQAIPYASVMLITRVNLSPIGCDTFFPSFNKKDWNVSKNGIFGDNWHVEVLNLKL